MMMMIIIVIIIIIITYNKSTFFSAPIFTEPTNAVESHALMYFFLYGASARLQFMPSHFEASRTYSDVTR